MPARIVIGRARRSHWAQRSVPFRHSFRFSPRQALRLLCFRLTQLAPEGRGRMWVSRGRGGGAARSWRQAGRLGAAGRLGGRAVANWAAAHETMGWQQSIGRPHPTAQGAAAAHELVAWPLSMARPWGGHRPWGGRSSDGGRCPWGLGMAALHRRNPWGGLNPWAASHTMAWQQPVGWPQTSFATNGVPQLLGKPHPLWWPQPTHGPMGGSQPSARTAAPVDICMPFRGERRLLRVRRFGERLPPHLLPGLAVHRPPCAEKGTESAWGERERESGRERHRAARCVRRAYRPGPVGA